MSLRTTFRTARELFHADNCEPLEQAARQGSVRLEAFGRGNYPGRRLPRHDLQGLCMAGFWNATTAQDWGLDWHCNEGIEIGYVSAGRLPFAVGDESWLVGPGHLTITRPWQRHRVGDPRVPASHYSWIILDVRMRRPNQRWQWPKWLLQSKDELHRLTGMLRGNEQPVWRGDRRIGDCFTRLDECVSEPGSETRPALLKIAVNELLVLLAGLLESRNPHLDESLPGGARTVRLFLEALHRRLDEPWTLDSMAEACGLARTRFATHCREIANATPVEFLTRCRIDAAAQLLTGQPNLSVTEIAFRCGFQSSQYFARVFRQQRGLPPSAWRNQQGRTRKIDTSGS